MGNIGPMMLIGSERTREARPFDEPRSDLSIVTDQQTKNGYIISLN